MQEAEYRNRKERMETGGTEGGKRGSESGIVSREEATVRRKQEEKGKEETEAE